MVREIFPKIIVYDHLFYDLGVALILPKICTEELGGKMAWLKHQQDAPEPLPTAR